MSRPLALLSLAVALLALGGASGARSDGLLQQGKETTEVVVALTASPLAYAPDGHADAVRTLRAEQRRFRRALRATIPAATLRWRYELVQNGFAVVLPASELPQLAGLPGVRRIFPSGRYAPLAGPAGATIRARALPGLPLASAGEGIKIGIIDDGVDQTHPFFDPAGYTMPEGFPKGTRAYTTAKVIVARAFAPAGTTYSRARRPFDAGSSMHGTHVAGIAAGNAGTNAGGARISGIAPRAWIGNYKALSIPTDAGVGLDGNAPELVAAIEAAVADGMDVINLSLGEPEIEPAEDVVALALDAAAAAGVVPVVAAGNDFDDFGMGSLTSPGSSARAITVAAVTEADPAQVAGFSSAGPTPLSLRLKPDVAAPGVGVLSSVPEGWETMSGTSMAAPHVSGAAALLLQRHPVWTPADVKAALTATARPVSDDGEPAMPVRAGSGLIDVAGADAPLVLADPTGISFGLLADGAVVSEPVTLTDAGGGAGSWDVAVVQPSPARAVVAVPPTVVVPGTLPVEVVVGADATDADLTGTIVLRRAGVTRRVPFWGRLATPALAGASATALIRPGVVRGSTSGKASRVTRYRYPDVPSVGTVTARLAGPEQLFRITLGRRVANLGVVILTRAKGVTVEPRVVEAADENRLTGYPALPFNLNPYLVGFGSEVLSAGALAPAPGTYHVVFDSATAAGAGAFTFRYWIDDTRPPSAQALTTSVRRGASLRVRVADGGSGVDPTSVIARIDGRRMTARLRGSVIEIATRDVARGKHVLRLQVSDYQETRNMENVARILPNTRVLRTGVTIR